MLLHPDFTYIMKRMNLPPKSVIQGYRVGSASDDRLRLLIRGWCIYRIQCRIVPDSSTGAKYSSVKRFKVGRVGVANSITSNTLTFNENHRFLNGETIRSLCDNAGSRRFR